MAPWTVLRLHAWIGGAEPSRRSSVRLYQWVRSRCSASAPPIPRRADTASKDDSEDEERDDGETDAQEHGAEDEEEVFSFDR